jgi:hypothetical protein
VNPKLIDHPVMRAERANDTRMTRLMSSPAFVALLVCLALSATAVAATPAVALSPAPGPVAVPGPVPAPGPGPAPLAPVRIAFERGTATVLPSVWVATASGQEAKELGPGDQALMSPNGEFVAATLFGSGPNSETGPAVGIYPVAGTGAAGFLSLATATATPLAWSPDSRYLAVSFLSSSLTDIARNSGLAVIDTTTGLVRVIANGAINGASFAPDGSDRIAYARTATLSPTAPVNIYISGPEGAGVKRFTGDGRSLNPVWGPRYIAYDRERPRKLAPAYQIWLRSPNGGRAKQLTKVRVAPLLAGLVPLAFSANGQRLVAEFEGEDTSEAWTVRVPSGRARRIIARGRPVTASGISRDGKTLLIDENAFENPPSSGRVAAIPFAGGRSEVLIAHGAEATWNG